MKFSLAMLLLVCINMAFADSLNSLVLTDAEMQKLKKYFPSDDNNHLIWTGEPLKVKLPLNQEKRIIFPDKIMVDLKGSLNTDQLRIINNDKSIYLTALQSFNPTKVYVTLKESGEVILVDLSIDDHASNEPLPALYLAMAATDQDEKNLRRQMMQELNCSEIEAVKMIASQMLGRNQKE